MMKEFPENCLKGIPNKSFLNKEGYTGTHLFYFKVATDRTDGLMENSINWCDDGAIEFTLNQKKEDERPQFEVGVAVLPREAIDKLSNWPQIDKRLSYERKELEHNPYHGNLLLPDTITDQVMRQIAGAIALSVVNIIPKS